MKTMTQELKVLTGKRTLKEAKIELGHMLALAYSAAYDPTDLFAIALEERWRILLVDNGYSVSYVDKSTRPFGWTIWSAMSVPAAYRYVMNPATLFLSAGSIETLHRGWENTHFHRRIVMLPWINPNDVNDLIGLAIDDYMANAGKSMFGTSNDHRLKEREYTPDGNKMLIDTGHAVFDKQTNAIGTGNFWANTIHGNYIRPHQETSCNGYFWEPGYLQQSDLKYYRDLHAPNFVLNAVKKAARDQSVILYALFHWYNRKGQSVRVVHGYILTDPEYKLIDSWVTGPTWKSSNVVETVLPYIAWKERPWQIKQDATKSWTIENTLTGRTKFIGPVRSSGTNYYDRAVAECERRNNLLLQKDKDGDK